MGYTLPKRSSKNEIPGRVTPQTAGWLVGLSMIALGTPGLIRAQVAPAADCPLAFQPYSTDKTPILDILIDPRAQAVVARDAPGFLEAIPGFLLKPEPPTLADVITLRNTLGFGGPLTEAQFSMLDSDLAKIPITEAVAEKRCARYDHIEPVLPVNMHHPAVLVFSKINGYRDEAGVNGAASALRVMAEQRHWSIFFTEDGGAFNRRQLSHFDTVVWNNVSGDVLTLPQRKEFQEYLARGGGFVGLHGSGGDPFCAWDWYADTLLGARFLLHPMNPQIQEARLQVDDPNDPIVQGLPAEWKMKDEWYSFKNDPRESGAHILLTIDEKSYSPLFGKIDLHMGDHPMAWTKRIGKGKSFYTAIGHRPESYSEPHVVQLIEQAIEWTAKR
jgi:hypothetical protein